MPYSRAMRRPIAWLACSLLALAGCGGSEPEPAPQPTPPDPTDPANHAEPPPQPAPRPRTGAELFLAHCATCHGETGDGQGETELEVPARSFQEGRFSFGDTPDQLFKTVSTGIPGRSPMPGFADVLSEDERRLVVAHVRTLLPPREEATRAESELTVGARPRVARGGMPPVIDGAPAFPRGLFVGLVEGLTFQYRADDVRLLCVRQGPFVNRADWNGRGGDALEPLGTIVYAFGGGDPPPPFRILDAPLHGRLTGTWERADSTGLTYALIDRDGGRVANVTEECAVRGLASGAAFSRQLHITAERDTALSIELVSYAEPARFPAVANGDLSAGQGVRVERADGTVDYLWIRADAPARLGPAGSALRLAVDASAGDEVELAVTYVHAQSLSGDEERALATRLAEDDR